MRNSEFSSAKRYPNQKKIKIIALVLMAVSFFGFLDAGYLTAKHYTKTPIVCSIFENCDKVTASPYAVAFGLPVALYGAVFYLTIFLSSLFYLTHFHSDVRRRNEFTILNLIFILSAMAFLASLYFIYLQLFVIKAICFYCLLSAVSSAILFILSLVLKFKVGRLTSY